MTTMTAHCTLCGAHIPIGVERSTEDGQSIVRVPKVSWADMWAHLWIEHEEEMA